KWLQYLLAPMQDGTFQEGQVTHPIGKCIFIFAGGTSPTLDLFGISEPKELDPSELEKLEAGAQADRRREYRQALEAYREFKLLKGPDFISRLHGFLDVLGPNPRKDTECLDATWPIRRALLLRGLLRLTDNEELNIDPGLLYALLKTSHYKHGARSFEKIVNTLAQGKENGRLHRSALPPEPLLNRETYAQEFQHLIDERNQFKFPPNMESLAASVHQSFLDGAEQSKLRGEIEKVPLKEWMIHPVIRQAYEKLPETYKIANRAAARRIPEHLALIDYVIVPQESQEDVAWKAP